MKIYEDIVSAINTAENIVITSHRSPDGDSIGCSLGLYHYLRKLDKQVTIVHPDPAPDFLRWLENSADIVTYEEQKVQSEQLLADADLIFSLDYNAPDRVGRDMEPALRNAKAKKVVIDHHPNPDLGFFDLVLSDTSAGSTSEMIFQMIEGSGNLDKMDATMGTPLYLGIMTDTGSFRFPSMKPETHEILAKLMRAGVVHYQIHEHVFDTNTVDRLKLRGYAVSEKLEIIPAKPIAYISLTEAELTRFNYKKGDTEGLVNMALSVEGIKMAAFFAEKDGIVKISFRSKGDLYVNEFAAKHFDGGGHKYAAGGMSADGISAAIDKFKVLINEYFPG
jgi:bifunctional oligoribonuclease and PAP phosphatase NrnA